MFSFISNLIFFFKVSGGSQKWPTEQLERKDMNGWEFSEEFKEPRCFMPDSNFSMSKKNKKKINK